MSILSTNLYGSSTNKGVGGLLSGLDTDDLVNQMAAGTRNKINRAYQSKQKLLYRQEAYREISSKLLSFSNKYLSFSSSPNTNILSSNFFNSTDIKSTSEYVSVSGNSENIKNFTITDVSSVATSASFNSIQKVSNQFVKSSGLTQFTSTIAGESMTIEHDGKKYTITIDSDFGKGLKSEDGEERGVKYEEVIVELNKQLAKIPGNENNEELRYELHGNSEEGYKIIIKTKDDKIAKLSAAGSKILDVLKMKVGEEASSQENVKIEDLSKRAEDILSNKDAYITFDYNGVLKKINLHSGITNKEELQTYLQNELDRLYGEGKIKVDIEDIKEGEFNGYRALKFSTINKEGKSSETDIFGVSGISKELGDYLGIKSETYNRLSRTKPLSEAGISELKPLGEDANEYKININGEELSFDPSMSLTDIINKINSNSKAGIKVFYASTTDTFTVRSAETGAHTKIEIEDIEGNLAEALFGSGYKIKEGTDTVMTYTLNGTEATITRSTASFTIDGMDISLDERAANFIRAENPVTFTVNNNTDEIVEKVRDFINDYNEIVSLLSSKTSERPRRDYQPLTPDQMEEMEKEEIELWTAEAKKGVLYGDSNMLTLLSKLKSIMSNKTSVSSLLLSDIGISSASLDRSGKLIFDEEKFKKALAQNPDEVKSLFTGQAGSETEISGISYQLQSVLRANVGYSGNSGILIDEAGLDNGLTSDRNYISSKIEEYDERLEKLKKSLEAEKERYWKKFSALEQALSNLNAQSAWLVDIMGGY